ncbi:MAG TPA: L-threonylcarbamoyladenylate synthase [Terracidiphilus sp.]|jgi:L-threonylcarbamoyladenylate synthase
MKTLRLVVDASRMDANDAVDRAAEILRCGGLVALPTETVYGLGANALDRGAVERIFVAKSRPAWDPVIVHVASPAMLEGLVEKIPETARRLMDAFWPGPLTLLLKRAAVVPDAVTAGRPLVGVRMPSHPVALELIRRARVPIAAPSANRFGHVSPTTAEHVLDDLDGRIDAVLDAGPTLRGVESTVIDPATIPMTIYRPGAVTAEEIAEIAGPVEQFRGGETLREIPMEALPSPGVGLKHYAPRARLVLVEERREELGARLVAAATHESGEKIGVMWPEGIGTPSGIEFVEIYRWGRWDRPETLAHGLYAGLRALDAAGCTVIVCPLPPAEGIGVAIRDRLLKAGTQGPRDRGNKRAMNKP